MRELLGEDDRRSSVLNEGKLVSRNISGDTNWTSKHDYL
jgi:hypothetical protein